MFERIFGNFSVYSNFSGFISMILVFVFFMTIVCGLILDNYWKATAQMQCQQSGYVWDNNHTTCTNTELIQRGR